MFIFFNEKIINTDKITYLTSPREESGETSYNIYMYIEGDDIYEHFETKEVAIDRFNKLAKLLIPGFIPPHPVAELNKALEMPITEFCKMVPPLSYVRIFNALFNQDIKTVSQLTSLTEKELLHFPDLGRTGINYIKTALEKLGLQLNT